MSNPQHQVVDKVTTGMTHGGAVVSVLGGITWNEAAVVVGIAVSVLGLFGNWLITWYWKSRHYRLETKRLAWDRRRYDRRDSERSGQGFSAERLECDKRRHDRRESERRGQGFSDE